MHRTRSLVGKSYENKQYCSTVFIYNSQVFDKKWHEGLTFKICRFDNSDQSHSHVRKNFTIARLGCILGRLLLVFPLLHMVQLLSASVTTRYCIIYQWVVEMVKKVDNCSQHKQIQSCRIIHALKEEKYKNIFDFMAP